MHEPTTTGPAQGIVAIPQIAIPNQAQTIPAAYPSAIAEALTTIMGEVGGVAKQGRNEFHRYDYVRIEDILAKVTPLLAKHGIMITQSEVGRSLFDDDKVVAVSYQFTITHKSGAVWPDRPIQTGMSSARNSKGGFDDKSFNKCHTAARKYFLKALFQITDGEDADNDADKQEDVGVPRHPENPIKEPKKIDVQAGKPHTIETKGLKFVDWAAAYVGVIQLATSTEEMGMWAELNKDALAHMKKEAPKVFARVTDAEMKRFDQLNMDAA